MNYIGYIMIAMPLVFLFACKVRSLNMKTGDVLITIVLMLVALLYGTLAAYFINPEVLNLVVFGGE